MVFDKPDKLDKPDFSMFWGVPWFVRSSGGGATIYIYMGTLSAISQKNRNDKKKTCSESTNKQPTARGFEPLRAEPNGYLVHLLNRTDTL